MKQTTLGHVAFGFPPESKQPKHHVSLDLLPLHCSLSARLHLWHRHCQAWPKTSLGLGRAGPKIIESQTKNCHAHRQGVQVPRGA